MLGRTPAGAVSNYVDSIQRLISCVSNAVVSVDGGYYVSDTSHVLRLSQGRPVRLGRASSLWLTLQQYYHIVEVEGPRVYWMIAVEGYEYTLIDAGGREILTYHWHPRGESPIAFHHLHLEHGAGMVREELQTAHLPTGYVSVADILRLLIVDFRVEPRRGDWEDVINRFQ